MSVVFLVNVSDCPHTLNLTVSRYENVMIFLLLSIVDRTLLFSFDNTLFIQILLM